MPVERKYCGTSNVVPPGYTGFDDRYSCLRKGFGVAKGKYGEAKQCRLNYTYFVLSIVLLVLCIIVLISVMIWLSVRKRDDDDDS
jgi:hypothetical protein